MAGVGAAIDSPVAALRASVLSTNGTCLFTKSFEHLMLDLLQRLCQAVVSLGAALRHARLKSVGAIRDAVRGNGL
jgi:hypothetical protein